MDLVFGHIDHARGFGPGAVDSRIRRQIDSRLHLFLQIVGGGHPVTRARQQQQDQPDDDEASPDRQRGIDRPPAQTGGKPAPQGGQKETRTDGEKNARHRHEG